MFSESRLKLPWFASILDQRNLKNLELQINLQVRETVFAMRSQIIQTETVVAMVSQIIQHESTQLIYTSFFLN